MPIFNTCDKAFVNYWLYQFIAFDNYPIYDTKNNDKTIIMSTVKLAAGIRKRVCKMQIKLSAWLNYR